MFLFCSNLLPQSSLPEFEHVSIEHGLSQGIINCIMQDEKGYLWFGTNDGLNRYDGYTFKIYRNIPNNSSSISDNYITSIAEDTRGNIWTGTLTGYLNKYEPSTGKFTQYKTQLHPLFANNRRILTDIPPYFANYNNSTITSIYCDENGIIWAGSFGNGLFRFDPYKVTFKQFYYSEDENSISSNYVLSICGNKNGSIWIGAFTGGLNKLTRTIRNNKESFKFTNYINQAGKNTFPARRITSVLIYNKELWIGAFGDGLYKLITSPGGDTSFSLIKFKSSKDKSLINNNITKLAYDRNGSLWIGTFGGGLCKYEPGTGRLVTFEHDPSNSASIDDNEVISLTIDRSGLVWTGTFSGYGVNKLNPFTTKFIHYKSEPKRNNSLSDNIITSCAEDKAGNIWFGTYKGGLNKFVVDKNEFQVFKLDQSSPVKINSNYITSLFIDRNNIIWVGTYNNGLIIFDPDKISLTHLHYNPSNKNSISSNQVTSIVEDKYGAIWIGTINGGLNKVTRDENFNLNFTNYRFSDIFSQTIPDNNIVEVFKDKQGVLWVTTREGFLCRFDYDAEDFFTFKLANPDEKAINISCLYDDSSNNLWLGTNGRGLLKFDKKNNKFIDFKNPFSLNGKTVYGILPDKKNNLWLSTNFGLLKYNIRSNSVTTYNLNDGLQSLQFTNRSYLMTKNGKMYFGGINGFNCFYPDSINVIPFESSVAISSIRAANSEIQDISDKLELSSSENSITIDFTVMDFTDPSKNQYSYILTGYDNDWNHLSGNNHTAAYNDLPPGNYTFKLKGANSAGIWSKKEIILSIIITGPFWKSWWFILIFVLIITGVAAYLISLKVFQYLEVEKLKAKISADLHDSVGSGLTEISMLCEITQMNLMNESSGTSDKLQVIAERSRTLIDSMSDIVWLVNPKPNTLYDLVLRLKDIYSPILYSLGISFKAEISEALADFKISMDKRQNIYLIFKEAINNSIKYSNSKEIKFLIDIESSNYQIILKDNGCGFDSTNFKPGNGLINMRKRAKSIKAEITIDSAPGKGTEISLKGKS